MAALRHWMRAGNVHESCWSPDVLLRTRLAALGLALLGPGCNPACAVTPVPWHDSRQLVIVTTSDWDANHGVLSTFVRSPEGWHVAESGVPVTIGRSGSAWGLGLNDAQPGPLKKEGDGRSPAGVFRIGTAFGYSATAQTALKYRAATGSDYCIDVETSPLYGRIVDAHDVGEAAVRGSTEPMRRDIHAGGDQSYKLGFVIEHNPAATTGAGSCIFVHLRRAPEQTTAGCTAMDEPAMRKLLAWLRPEQHPVFVLLPLPQYERVKRMWNLPQIAAAR
jgi:L,D-peptidoglycan transpeptidase YkuD (ErfK/YbiS/YcfS/YnhG family)